MSDAFIQWFVPINADGSITIPQVNRQRKSTGVCRYCGAVVRKPRVVCDNHNCRAAYRREMTRRQLARRHPAAHQNIVFIPEA